MIISHKYKFIFLHAGKAGGASVGHELWKAIGPDAEHYVPYRHSNAKDSRTYVGDEIWNEYFKFSTARNPFIRTVSWYNHAIKNYRKAISKLVDKVEIGKIEKEIEYLGDISNFGKMIKLWLTEGYRKKAFNRIDKFYIFQDQVDWFNDGNGINLDLIMKLETIESEWGVLCNRIGIPYPYRDTSKRWGLPHINIGVKGDSQLTYRKYYTPELINLIKEIHKRDLEYFNYTF